MPHSHPVRCRPSTDARWGAPAADPFVADGAFVLPAHRFGNVVIGIQPARGYNIDPKASYHDPDLVPPHGYFAFYFWLREASAPTRSIHMGKHGNLEWLPGKALALSAECYPEAALGPLPVIYPFIVNDPGEGAQAKRRTAAVVVDHLMPPMARAESYGPAAELEALIDEYAAAAGRRPAPARSWSPRRSPILPQRARLRPRPRPRSEGAIARAALAEARRASLRSEGAADPRRAACAWAKGRQGGSARRRWWRSRACRAAAARQGTPRCSARSPTISGSASIRWTAISARRGTGRGRRRWRIPSPLAGEGGEGGRRRSQPRLGAPSATRSSGWRRWRSSLSRLSHQRERTSAAFILPPS